MVFKSTSEFSTYTNTPYLVGSCAIYTHRVSIIHSIIIFFFSARAEFLPSWIRFGSDQFFILFAKENLLYVIRCYDSFIIEKKGKRAALRWDLILDRDFCFCKSFWSIFKRDEMFDMSLHLISVSGIELKLTETSVHEELSLIFMSERWKIIIFRQIRMQIVYGADGDQQQSVFFLTFSTLACVNCKICRLNLKYLTHHTICYLLWIEKINTFLRSQKKWCTY